VRGNPGQLLGLGPLFEQICQLIGPICNLATFPDLSDLLGGLLGGLGGPGGLGGGQGGRQGGLVP
jgi:hypothetical protein